jgi:hypothetical protein
LRAAQYTAKRAAKEPISDPWAYTVAVFNNNLARLGLLYDLTHWAESGIRSQVDLGLSVAFGDTWYRYPERYLPTHQLTYFIGDAAHRDLRWESDTRAAAGKRVADYPSPADFLEQITFGWLIQIVLHGYYAHLRGILVTRDGKPVTRDEAISLLEAARVARNAVAHNRYMTNEQYRWSITRLLRLLELLRFDVAKAIQRLARSRNAVVMQALKDLGIEPSVRRTPPAPGGLVPPASQT